MNRRIICIIQAFECEKTIEAAMRSVLEQTYPNWLCFVISNGNRSDWSFDVIKNIGALDSRFVVLNKKDNDVGISLSMLYYLAQRFPDSYLCTLDADDAYLTDFFERAVTLAEKYELDIVSCGTEITLKRSAEATEETLLKRRALEQDLIVRKKDFTNQFLSYKSFFNEMWGKLYRASLFDERHNDMYIRKSFELHFMPDMLFTIDTLSRSRAIGVLSGTSHKYYQYELRSALNATALVNAGSARQDAHGSRSKKNKRRFSIYATYETFMSFLEAHGKISDALYEYMQAVLFGWFGDFYMRTLLLLTDEVVAADLSYHLVFNPKFDELMSYQDNGIYDNLRDFIKRAEFCERLKNQLIGQMAIKNRVYKNREKSCDAETRQKIAEIIKRLDNTIEMISHRKQTGGGQKC